MRRGDCCAEADGLGGVMVGGEGRVVSTVDLGEGCQLLISVK